MNIGLPLMSHDESPWLSFQHIEAAATKWSPVCRQHFQNSFLGLISPWFYSNFTVPMGPINNVPALVQTIAWCRPDVKPPSVWLNLLTHICRYVTPVRWILMSNLQCQVNITSLCKNTLQEEFTIEDPMIYVHVFVVFYVVLFIL